MASWDGGRIRLTVTEDFSFSRGKLLLYSLILEMNYRIFFFKKKGTLLQFFFSFRAAKMCNKNCDIA